MFQDEIQANVEKWKKLEKLKPPKKEKSAAVLKAEAERKKIVDRDWYLAYRCQCARCLYSYGLGDDLYEDSRLP